MKTFWSGKLLIEQNKNRPEGQCLIISTPVAMPDIAFDCDDNPESDALGVAVEVRQIVFGSEEHGLRLDQALAQRVPEVSRSYLRQLIDAGAFQFVGGKPFKATSKIKAGEAGQIELRPTPQSQAFVPENMVIDVVYQDDHLLVLNKPAGLVVHPAPGNWRGTLLNGLLALDKKAASLPRAGIVHRLDKDTSGLMVVARTRETMDALVRAIAARTVHRRYVAVTHKAWTGAAQVDVDAPIGRDPRNRLRMAMVDLQNHSGKTAKTSVKVLHSQEQGSLVLCTLHTGRTHQIRVHMASLQKPLVGDVLYGGAMDLGLERQALHALQLAFTHPVSQQELAFEAPLPQDFQNLLQRLNLRYNAP